MANKFGKRLRASYEGIERNKDYGLDEAVALVKKASTAKFDETVEIALNLGVDTRHADQNVRGVVTLPNGTGKSVRVAVFARGPKAEEATAAGADVVGAEELQAQIQGGEINFERCIATPDMMPVVGRLGKILGPRGMMPNPKLGTVTNDVTAAVQAAKGGQVEFRAGKSGHGPCRGRQGELRRGCAGRQHPGLRSGDSERQAERRQGDLYQTGLGQLDHGSGRQDRCRRFEQRGLAPGADRRA